jgi:hypothetical protein
MLGKIIFIGKREIKFSLKELTKLLKILKGVLLKELASQKH